jgi:hypothetical protein
VARNPENPNPYNLDPNPYNLDFGDTYLKDLKVKVRITRDEDPESPRDWEPMGTMVCWHSRYNLGDKDGVQVLKEAIWSSPKADDRWDLDYATPGELYQYAQKCNFIVLPLYLYDHSGITMNTGGFSCPWDSGQVGFIFMTPEQAGIPSEHGVSDEELVVCAEMQLQTEVDIYDRYIRGEVYGYVIEDDRGNHLESCFGFYGMTDVIAGATEMIDSLKNHPPATVLTDLEAKLLDRILELRRQIYFENDPTRRYFPRQRVLEEEAEALDIRVAANCA